MGASGARWRERPNSFTQLFFFLLAPSFSFLCSPLFFVSAEIQPRTSGNVEIQEGFQLGLEQVTEQSEGSSQNQTRNFQSFWFTQVLGEQPGDAVGVFLQRR